MPPQAQGHSIRRGCQLQDRRINFISWAGKRGQDPKLSLTPGSSLLSNNLLSLPPGLADADPLYL